MKQKIVFFGAGWYTVPVVEKLLDHGLDLVVTTEKNPESLLLKFCVDNNIQTITAQTGSGLINHKSLLTNHNVAILASYGAFVPDEIINIFPNGIINIHPSLLPKWKGPSPIQYSLLNVDAITGVTLIKLDNEIDHGPIISQKPYNLTGNETSEDLLSILFEIGAEMVEEIVIKLENNGVLKETPQEHSKETWSYKIEKKDGMIDISNPPDRIELTNKIRAFYPWPGVWFRNNEIAASPLASRNDKKGHPEPLGHSERSEESKLQKKIIKLLPEEKIQVEGKNLMNYKDFLNGFGEEGKEILRKLGLL